MTETIFNEDKSVTYLERHGIKLVFAQTGSIGIFSPIALLNNLIAAMALLSLATLTVDTIMLKLLPKKDLYNDAKFQETLNLNDLNSKGELFSADEKKEC
jgi:hypothetical protein